MKRFRKAIAAAAGGVLSVVSTATVPESWQPWTALAGSIATVVLVVLAPANAPKDQQPAARHAGGNGWEQLGG